jgi:hypothetical protein
MTAAPAGKEYSVARRVGDIDISFSFTLEEYYAGEGRGDYTLACGRDGEIFESIAFDSYMFPSERTVRFTDFTFDGIPDLCVDINKAADNVTTRLFVWDADSEMFRESEVLVGSRWGFEPDRRLMSVYTSAGPGAGDYAVYRWNDGAFETVRRAYIKTSPEGGFTRVFVSLADRIGDGYEDREYEYLKLGDPDIGAIIYGGL